mmetsp:Transcript_5129/g.4705  ORF Transcript_5129/g.4705 Transcript_5129/m.4705 type:complete len:83 (+) Transcript_5129:496-744(+)
MSQEHLKLLLVKLEEDLELQKNKKVSKANTKKQKDKIGSSNTKLLNTKKIKEKLEELLLQMEFIEAGTINTLRNLLTTYMEN